MALLERTEYELLQQVRVAGEAYCAAAAEYARISGECELPDGALALRRAATNEEIAFQRYSDALAALAQVIHQGRSPFRQTQRIVA
jgi:hypothetical protein